MPMGDAGDYRNWADLRDLLLQLVGEASVHPQVLYMQDGERLPPNFCRPSLWVVSDKPCLPLLASASHVLDLRMPSSKLLKDPTWFK